MNDKILIDKFMALIESATNMLSSYVENSTNNMKQRLEMSQLITKLLSSDKVQNDLEVQTMISKMALSNIDMGMHDSMTGAAVLNFADALGDFVNFLNDEKSDESDKIDKNEDDNRSDKLRDLAEKCVANGYTTDEIKELFKRV